MKVLLKNRVLQLHNKKLHCNYMITILLN